MEKCEWKESGEGNEGESASVPCCDTIFELTPDVESNIRWGFKFCPYCGKEIEWKTIE